MATDKDNTFSRYGYSPRYDYDSTYNDSNSTNNMVVFSGGDLQAYINNIKVGNLESLTWSISVEVVGNYVMGRRDAVVYTTGKRVVVGSMVLSQYDRHALLEQIFQISKKGITSIGSLWTSDYNNGGTVGQQAATSSWSWSNANTASVKKIDGVNIDNYKDGSTSNLADTSLSRGLNRKAFEEQLQQQLRETARMIGATKFSYSDQLPPFDLTLVGVTKSGQAARCSIFGMQVTQETAGFSQNDLGNSVGMSFVALAVSPWRQIELGDQGGLTLPTTP